MRCFQARFFPFRCHLVRRTTVVLFPCLARLRKFLCLQAPMLLLIRLRLRPVRRRPILPLRRMCQILPFLAAVVNAVKVALAAEKTPPSSDGATVPVSVPDLSCSSSLRVSGGVPSQADLSARTATFLSSGLGFSSSQAASSSPASSGRNNYAVPSFVSTFVNPSSAVSSSVFSLSSLVPATSLCVVSTAPATNLPSGPLLQQPFVVGLGFSPVPAKTVNQIVSGKFVDLSDLLSVNIVHTEPESQVLLDGRLVFTPSTKRNRRQVEDISSWCEAFAIFTLILTSSFPHRWKDLTCYKLLILRTYRQFSGRVWLAYDRAFREHTAAAGITDWSSMNVQLYNLCYDLPKRTSPLRSNMQRW